MNNVNEKKLTGSFFIKAYTSFNYTRFLGIFRSTRYTVYSNRIDNLVLCLIAFSDPYYSKSMLEDYLNNQSSDIVDVNGFRTWKQCNTAFKKYLEETETDSEKHLTIISKKEYIPGKKNDENPIIESSRENRTFVL